MFFRLLYRLFQQRIDERQYEQRLSAETSTFSTPQRQQTIGHRESYRLAKRWTILSILVAALLALGWQFYKPLPSNALIKTDQAELRLLVQASDSWPVVVYLRGAGLAPATASAAHKNIDEIKSTSGTFSPAFQVLPEASTLDIINSDAIAHNTHIFNRGDTIFNVALPEPGVSVRKTLTGSGIFDVRCDLHPWMRATIFVPPSHHYAVFNEPDSVNFSQLPAGQYALHLWQANSPERIRLLDLSGGETKTLRLD